ncbi:MAG: PIN domain-containing protein [Nanoarchaeota archaeon]
MKIILDTSALIDFFEGGTRGEKVWSLLKDAESYVSIVTLSEIVNWCLRNDKNVDYIINRVKKSCKVMPLSEEISVDAGKIYTEVRKIKSKFGMIDSLIYTSARLNNLILITTDKDFLGLKDVEIID